MADTFNALTQHFEPQAFSSQPQQSTAHENTAPVNTAHSDADSHYIPRPKRIACVLCRKRKLRCDGKRPSCGTCSRLGHECIYDEVRKKSGPKRGYVKQLEARLAQVETLLKSQEANAHPSLENGASFAATNSLTGVLQAPPGDDVDPSMSLLDGANAPALSVQAFSEAEGTRSSTSGGELISLGLEEPLPAQEVIDELNAIYFEKVHPGLPMIHRPKYLASLAFAPSSRPPVCLQYMIWCLAASVSDKYSSLHETFYQQSRKYAELDELKGLGGRVVSLAHCQAWLLISTYEFKMMFFPRAWLSSGKASRLAIMMGLNRLDGQGLDVKQTLPPANDWTEKEERRRVFWAAFCIDRYASIGTGWPFTIDERDISSKLPASDESFIENTPQETPLLPDVLEGEDITMLSPYGGVVVLGCMFGRNITHLHRPEPQDNDHDLNGVYWQRHRSLDNILLHISLAMPCHLRLSVGTTDPNVIFCNMAIHTATICLHQAAIFKSEKNKMPEQIATESKRRCIVAADQISNIMKMISHLDLSVMNPFMSFCVYLAARVFIQYLKFRPSDSAARSSLQFAFSALHKLKTKNPLTGSFILQLNLDIEGSAFGDALQSKSACFTGGQQQDAVRKPHFWKSKQRLTLTYPLDLRWQSHHKHLFSGKEKPT
ncbi:hypothetical protein BO70DRAFT_46469 [Aspergillus heteromorphus CBS 117.55]|uniref:Zn(2)-C6 fungal-type domain-containing protein n=1 Tax=Aspergillus heteromorphus CBS 117.55 TaxID=1448321 RepID=A0A317W5L4_9EURO|nr:uncharacterized protein BO70DRAFT_46469 [Aspergillus heteromorphus CBS 117.55]PWY80622.1 hypothetical protein BO70DRAFT_46469 [Aspergillus heteromorphus CBS 117.55]